MLQLSVDRGGRVPMAIGALLVLDPLARPSPVEVRRVLVERASALPRLRQRLVGTPPAGGRPVWLEAGSEAVADRVDSLVIAGLAHGPTPAPPAAPSAPSVPRALLDAATELVLTRLPPGAPLWRARLLLDEDGAVAGIAVVAHHVLADGMGGLAVLGALADPATGPRAGGAGPLGAEPADEGPGRASGGPNRPPEPLPPLADLVRDAWRERLAGLGRVGRGTRRLAGGLDELGLRRPRLAERCSLLGDTGDRRRVEVATAGLAAVREQAHARAATVNDVVVTAVTGALVELLARRGERVDELVVSVPVSRRRQGDAGALGNATGVVPVRVPAVADRQRRLAVLVAQRSRLSAPERGGSAAVLTPLFRGLAAVGAFQPFVDHQRLVHTFVTNVRGPAERLRVAGAEVGALVPVVVNPGNVAVSFDVLSYAGTLGVTLVCDPGLVPESAWIAERVTAGLTEPPR